MNERAARHKFWQILSAVEYCHNQGIVHRDLKVRIIYILNINIKSFDCKRCRYFSAASNIAQFVIRVVPQNMVYLFNLYYKIYFIYRTSLNAFP